MAIQKAAGNYWRIASITLRPDVKSTTVALALYESEAAFLANAQPIGGRMIVLPANSFTAPQLNNIVTLVQNVVLQNADFVGGTIL